MSIREARRSIEKALEKEDDPKVRRRLQRALDQLRRADTQAHGKPREAPSTKVRHGPRSVG